ncbi:MAG: NrtR DNA-binding winged helix domain-containing protein, partial [Brevibacterium aurantiacum]
GLLPEEFSLRQLRELHEIVSGENLQADSFRRTMLPLLAPTGHAVSQGRGRPAQTFTRRSEIALRSDVDTVAPAAGGAAPSAGSDEASR